MARAVIPAPLTRTTGRTRTGRTPIEVTVTHVQTSGAFDSIYAGPPAIPASGPLVAGDLAYRDGTPAVQVRAVASDAPQAQRASLTVVLDLGTERDVSRIEFYGNFLQPPVGDGTRPITNFGLPHGVGVAVMEDFDVGEDLHGLPYYDVWPGPDGGTWQPRALELDLRGLWGWTPLHLPPTFGRYLMLHFFDLPRIFPFPDRTLRRGIDIQRIVVYPFTEDVEQRPQVEYAPISSRQTRFHDSAYWATLDTTPRPETHESIYRDEQDRLYLPSVLANVPFRQPGPKPVLLYSSDVVEPDGDERVVLTLRATTDETPLLAGVALLFSDDGPLPDYRIRVETCDDEEAARSPSLKHSSWVLARAETLVRASQGERPVSMRLLFPHVRHARFVRLVVQVLRPAGPETPDFRFVLAALSLLRPRDFVLAPEPGEEYTVDYAVLRMRGRDLAADYAYVDGASGAAMTLEMRGDDGAWQRIHTFRSLLDLVENTQNRLIANPRYPERVRQTIREAATSQRESNQTTESTSGGWSEARTYPEYDNVQISESGSVTEHTGAPGALMQTWAAAGNVAYESQLPDAAGYVLTERHYLDPANLPNLLDGVGDSIHDLVGTQPPAGMADLGARMDQVIRSMDNASPPFTVSFGVSTGVSAGAVGGSVSGGLSFGGSLQLGGGLTRSKTSGSQGSFVQGETRVTYARNKQDLSSSTRGTTHDSSTVNESREVDRLEETTEERRRVGATVRYAGEDQDLLLVAIPLNIRLRGPQRSKPVASEVPPSPGDVLRLRVDHLPRGVVLDVEFRGNINPLGGPA